MPSMAQHSFCCSFAASILVFVGNPEENRSQKNVNRFTGSGTHGTPRREGGRASVGVANALFQGLPSRNWVPLPGHFHVPNDQYGQREDGNTDQYQLRSASSLMESLGIIHPPAVSYF